MSVTNEENHRMLQGAEEMSGSQMIAPVVNDIRNFIQHEPRDHITLNKKYNSTTLAKHILRRSIEASPTQYL